MRACLRVRVYACVWFAILGQRLFLIFVVVAPLPLFILYTNDIRVPVLLGFSMDYIICVSQCVQNAGGKTLIHADHI